MVITHFTTFILLILIIFNRLFVSIKLKKSDVNRGRNAPEGEKEVAGYCWL
jgi:hypothetical protein